MAGKTDAEKGKGKGAAFAKWAKIDKAQRNMFIAVCLASIVLGVTAVSIIYFAKVIAFNAKLMDEKSAIIKDLTATQKSLESISDQIDALADNENLEVVARDRSADCETLLKSGVDVTDTSGEIEILRTCSSLRVIPDALPSKQNNEAMLASLNYLLVDSGKVNLEGLALDDEVSNSIFYESESDSDSDSDSDSGDALKLSMTGASVTIDDSEVAIRRALRSIESSVRSYDFVDGTFSWSTSDDADSGLPTTKLSFTGSFRTYYSGVSDITEGKKKVCADQNSSKCNGGKK